jgi:hypothetical protein
MNKLLISLALLLTIASCKGPRSGPLVKESFNNAVQGQGQAPVQNPAMPGQSHAGQVTSEKINVAVTPCTECITIAKLLANKQLYSGKIIKIKGSVTKFNPAIMGKNWVHIQDGTEFEGGFDLTITTDKTASVGETITFEGKIVLNKDFGYGYVYNIIMEEAQPVL